MEDKTINYLIDEASKFYGIEKSIAQEKICAYISAGDIPASEYDQDDIRNMYNELFAEKTIIKQVGFGTGAGEDVEVLAKEEIEKIIDEMHPSEAFEIAYKHWSPRSLNGYCAINLETGKVFGYGMQSNQSFHACDNNHVDLYCIDANDEIDEDEVEFYEAEWQQHEDELFERYYERD
jgi:hypothetical protein